jgi:hypothetical protein
LEQVKELMSKNPPLIAVCPIFGFQISQVLKGRFSEEESREYFKRLFEKFNNGIQLTDEVKLRRMNNSDFDQLKKSLPLGLDNTFSQLSHNTFVIEFAINSEWNNYESTINEILLAMRLFKTGKIYSNVIWHKNDTLMTYLPWINSSDYPFGISGISYNYEVKIEEVEDIKKILEKIKKSELTKSPSFRISVKRFSRSYEDCRWDDKLIDLAIAFEALFIEGNKSPTVPAGQLVGIGCSMLIGKDTSERKAISNFISEAFCIRNKLVHGTEATDAIRIKGVEYNSQDFIAHLEDYFRMSIKKLL